MSVSKRTKCDDFLSRAVRVAIGRVALDYPEHAMVLVSIARQLRTELAAEIVWDDYRFRQLADIFAWKKPPKVAE